MTREELIEKMLDAYQRLHYSHNRPTDGYNSLAMAAALDVAVGELLLAPQRNEFQDAAYAAEMPRFCDQAEWLRIVGTMLVDRRRSRYLPKSDPAVEAADRVMLAEMDHFGCKNGQVVSEVAAKVVAAVRAADKGSHALR